MLLGVHFIAMTKRLNGRLNVIFNEISDLCTNGLVFWRQSEINHVLPPSSVNTENFRLNTKRPLRHLARS